MEELYGIQTGQEPCKKYSVPVRRGGPWRGDGSLWERWRGGKYRGNAWAYRVHKGMLQYLYLKGQVWLQVFPVKSTDALTFSDELRAPKGYDGPCPEGCRWLEDEITEDEEWEPRIGDLVKLQSDSRLGRIAKVSPGMIMTERFWLKINLHSGDAFSCNGSSVDFLERGRWVPKIGDRVRYKEDGRLGRVKSVNQHVYFSKPTISLDVEMDNGSFIGAYSSDFEPVEGEWVPEVGDRVRGTRDDWKGLLGVISIVDGPTDYKVDWDVGQKYPYGATPYDTYFSGSYGQGYVEHIPRVRPDGTLDLPVRRVSREEWDEKSKRTVVECTPTSAALLMPHDAPLASWSGRSPLRVHANRLQWQNDDRWTSSGCFGYQPGDEDYMEWIVCEGESPDA